MCFQKKFRVIFIIILMMVLNVKNLIALENKILFKVDNEIITSIDIYNEVKFLKVFNPEMNNLNDIELFEISKNSILREKIKKIEIKNFVKELKVDDKYILNLIKKKYSKMRINSLENLEDYLKDKNLKMENVKEKFTIELIWNDLIYQKFYEKIIIDKEKIRKEIMQNPSADQLREILLSEIVFNVNNKDEFDEKYERILLDIKNQGFKKTALMYSNSETAANGGLIGWVKENNLNQNIKKIISELKPGELTKPIRTSSGFIILKIDEEKNYESKSNLDEKVRQAVNFKINDQLNQFSNMYFNKLKKSMIIHGL